MEGKYHPTGTMKATIWSPPDLTQHPEIAMAVGREGWESDHWILELFEECRNTYTGAVQCFTVPGSQRRFRTLEEARAALPAEAEPDKGSGGWSWQVN